MKSAEQRARTVEAIDGAGDGVGIVGVRLQIEFLDKPWLADRVGDDREAVPEGQAAQGQDQDYA